MLKRLGPASSLLIWAAWLASAYLLSGPASYVRQHDTAEVNTPYYTALPRLAERGLLGFRDPLGGTGVDALSNLKGDMPLVEALFRFAPHWSNSGVLLLAQTFVAGVGLFVLMRRQFGVSRLAALLPAAWFAFLPWVNVPYSGFPTWYGWYVPALPLVLLALRSAARLATGARPAAIATGALLALGTPTASGLPVLPFVAAWMVVFADRGWRRSAGLAAWFSVAFLVVKAPTIGALLVSAPESHRLIRSGLPFGVQTMSGLWASRLVEALDLVRAHGALLAVALLGWVTGGFRNRPFNFLVGGIAALIVVTIVTPVLQAWQGALGAVFRTYQFDRVNRLMPLIAAAACALALESMRRALPADGPIVRRAKRRLYVGSASALGILVVSLTVVMNREREGYRQAGNRYDAFFAQAPLEALAREQTGRNPFRVVSFADRNANQYGLHAAFAWAYGLETADFYGTTYPLRYHQFWARVIEPVTARRPDIRDYYGRWGNMAYLFNPAATLFDPLPAGAVTSLSPLPFNLSMLSLANVRYVLSKVPLDDDRLRMYASSPDLLVYVNVTALPRFFVVHDWRGVAGTDRLLDAVAAAGPEGLRTTALVDIETASRLGPPPDSARTGDSSVEVRLYTADRIELAVTAAAPGLLVAANSYSPHWRAMVDGGAASVVPAYHTFQGVAVEAGSHHVVLSYEPPHSFGGRAQPALIAGALACLTGVSALVSTRRGTTA